MAALPPYVETSIAKKALAAINLLRRYHRHTVQGMDHIPRAGAALVVVHHSFATYDIAMLGCAIFAHTGRIPRALADRLIFKVPPLARVVSALGGVEGHPEIARTLLQSGHLVMVAPGGMREALRPSQHRYQLSWDNRLGFARLAIALRVPVIVAACPSADDLFTLYANPLTQYCLHRWHLPVPLLRGWGASLVPRPRRMTHFIAPPIEPPMIDLDNAPSDALVRRFQRTVAQEMQHLLET